VKRILAFIISMSAVVAGFADTNVFPVLVAGREAYTNATILRVTPSDAIVRFESGIARVPLSSLPSSLQRQYGYDPQKAAQFVAEQAQKEAERRKQLAIMQQQEAAAIASAVRVRVFQILADERYSKCLTGTGTIWVVNLPPQ
jgi:hypothetical protein